MSIHNDSGLPPLRVPIEVQTYGDDLVMVVVRGEVDLPEAGELRAVLNDACTGPHRSVAVDLSGLRFIGSSGMGVLIDAHRRMVAQGRHLAILDPTDPVRRAFEVAGLARLLR